MSEELLRAKAEEFELELSYQEWLRDNVIEPTTKELDEMEEDFIKSSTVKNRIIALQSLNNIYYNPKYGA